MRRDPRIPSGPRRWMVANWLVEARATGEAIVVETMTLWQLNDWANQKFGLTGWEIHDREDTGRYAFEDVA